jgi:hypothetical protein
VEDRLDFGRLGIRDGLDDFAVAATQVPERGANVLDRDRNLAARIAYG